MPKLLSNKHTLTEEGGMQTFVITLISVATILVAVESFFFVRTWWRSEDEISIGGDVILVLCHFLKKNGALSEEFHIRLDKAIALWETDTYLSVVVNGGRTLGTPRSQGAVAAEYLMANGVPAQKVMWSERGHDTLDEVNIARDIVEKKGWGKIIVISNFFHLTQADVALSRRGVVASFVPTPLRIRGLELLTYIPVRFVIPLLTWLDPEGKGRIFKSTRGRRGGTP
ncbi:MAG TPA: YdcF family protein [Candidatus Paceibacterota bacterium]